ncbi:CpaF family protein [Paenibacillus sp. ACRRX]|uniref:CpaF family protein n=1 Tax=unclassified Paenibacillus TaxID=185978 RepID=UPI001EF509DC|nr:MULTISPECIES: CpaF family protein [unclassified Paenibacillus]MCG7409164.1 CpaF family protein [Paenibacillus sp. ACRRX]MDK8181842.1 CpaF family protein [Paenibacillus sp. UMB4589-SE434]
MNDEQLVAQLKEQIRRDLDVTSEVSDEKLLEFVEDTVFRYSEQHYLTASQKQTFIQRIYDSFRGLDVLQPLINNKSITEIMINGHDEIFIERDGRVLRYDAAFESKEKLEDIIQIIVGKVNRVVNESSPIVDARLEDGSRVNVVLPPIALKGPTMTIRKFPEKPLDVEDLVKIGSLTGEAAQFLKMLVQARYNIFIGGGTGSGKTTFLNALSNYIPDDERIITIEDSAELQIRSVPNLVSLETRNANTEGKGEISIRELIKSSLRMRPNRIVVGEVRGAEALDMLQAMNTGHDGSLSTGHANSTVDMLSRLETMVLSGAHLPVEVVRKQISSAIDIMVHLSRLRDKSRKVVEISEIIGVVNGEIELNPLYQFVETGETPEGKIIGGLVSTGNRLREAMKLQMAGFKDIDLVMEGRS